MSNEERIISRKDIGGRTRLAQFLWQRIRKSSKTAREEYLSSAGQWSDVLDGKVIGRRLVYPSPNEASEVKAVAQEWDALNRRSINRPVLPEKAYDRLVQAQRTQVPVVLFVPWGVRPEGQIGQAEYAALDRLQGLQRQLVQGGIPTEVLVMPADVYATEINGLDPQRTRQYFQIIQKEVKKRGLSPKNWSGIRSENRDLYDRVSKQLTDGEIDKIIGSSGTMNKLFAAGRRRSQGVDPKQATYAYIRERMCEARIIEQVYKPIKVSLAPKNKDNNVDGDLPRLYLIPPELQLPWLK